MRAARLKDGKPLGGRSARHPQSLGPSFTLSSCQGGMHCRGAPFYQQGTCGAFRYLPAWLLIPSRRSWSALELSRWYHEGRHGIFVQKCFESTERRCWTAYNVEEERKLNL